MDGEPAILLEIYTRTNAMLTQQFAPEVTTKLEELFSGRSKGSPEYDGRLRGAGKILNLRAANRPRQCEHVKSNGEFCGSPALRGRSYCYFHLTHIGRRLRAERNQARTEAQPPESSAVRLELPPFEDRNAIQIALMQVVDALLDNRIDTKRAGQVLYALQTASSNLAHGASFERANATAVASRYEDFEEDFELGDETPELRKDEAEEVQLDDEHAAAAREQQVLEACARLEETQKEAEEAERIAALDDGSDVFLCDAHAKFMCMIKGPLSGAVAADNGQQAQTEREAASQRLEMGRSLMAPGKSRLAQETGEPFDKLGAGAEAPTHTDPLISNEGRSGEERELAA